MSASFTHLATVTASTKRSPDIDLTTKKAGDATTWIASLKCTRLIPVGNSDELQKMLQLETFVQLLETYVQDGLDIITGDFLVVATKEYPVRLTQPFPFGNEQRLRIVLEDIKR